MKKRDLFSTFIRIAAILAFGVFFSGVNYCQRSFNFMGQTAAGTVTATPTETSDDDELVPVETPTETPIETPEETETPIATATTEPTNTPVPTNTPEPTATVAATSLLGALSRLGTATDGKEEASEKKSDQTEVGDNSLNAGTSSRSKSEGGNWLGKAFSGKENQPLSDSDADGFTDQLEASSGTDARDAHSTPPAPTTNVAARFVGIDDDLDGVANTEEIKLGLNPRVNDSDGDGVRDGAEILSGSDPLSALDLPADSDGDGLSDVYEVKINTNPQLADSDGDGLRDDYEVVLGSNPRNKDSDGDGILDWKEMELGGDPTLADSSL
ncbi:hypothetical protein OAO01_05630 [Oligoflexia bacterium]|nr:hypothetical protein [Oligoflexia bacterium]